MGMLLSKFNKITEEECNQAFPLTFRMPHIVGSTIKQLMQMDEMPNRKYSFEGKIECQSCNNYRRGRYDDYFYICGCGQLSFLSFTITNLGCSAKININISIKLVDSNVIEICNTTKDMVKGESYQHAWKFDRMVDNPSGYNVFLGNCFSGNYLSLVGNMRLICNMKVLKTDEKQISQKIDAEFPCFYKKLGYQFSEANTNNLAKQLSDVIICVGENKMHCHKLVLAMSSRYFERMFLGAMKESKEKEVVLQEIDLETLKSVLTFMYTDVIPNEKINVQVLAASDMYEILRLREICCSKLSLAINLENVADIWIKAYKHSIEGLTHDAIAYMAKKLENADGG